MDLVKAGGEGKDQGALLEYRERYRILTEIMPLGSFQLGPDPDFLLLSANRQFSLILGYNSEDNLEGISFRDLMVHPCAWQDIATDLTEKGLVRRREVQLRHKEGSGILVSLNATVLHSADHGVWIEGVADDVTERKVIEMEMQYHESELNRYIQALTDANKKLNLLSSITRHDILNQLTALSGYLVLMNEDSHDPKMKKYIEHEKRIAETIGRQIQFARDYHEIGVQSSQWFDVKKTIAASSSTLPLSPGVLEINIENLSIYADVLLEKVFYNLVENALRHGKNLTRISFSFFCRGDSLTIICEDNGEGVPEKFKEAIFNRQYFKNTGFGLFLTREILGITGCSIIETGQPGKGARFEIQVPPGYFQLRNQATREEQPGLLTHF
jgi:PAS domain S-box-containing protein